MPNFPSLILTGKTPSSTYQNLVQNTGSYLVNAVTGDSFFDLSGSIGSVSAGNGAPTVNTPGYLYLQWDSTPAGVIWWKDANGNWN